MPVVPFIPLIAAGISTVGGALQNRGSSQQTSATSPTIAPEYQGLQSQVLARTLQRLNTPIDLSGYRAQGLADIGHAGDLGEQALSNALAARGLSRSPVAGAGLATLQAGRLSDVARLQNAIPLLSDQLQRQNLLDASGVLAGGRGQVTTGTGQVSQGGGAAGAATNLAGMLGYLYGQGAFGRTPSVRNLGAVNPMMLPGYNPGAPY